MLIINRKKLTAENVKLFLKFFSKRSDINQRGCQVQSTKYADIVVRCRIVSLALLMVQIENFAKQFNIGLNCLFLVIKEHCFVVNNNVQIYNGIKRGKLLFNDEITVRDERYGMTERTVSISPLELGWIYLK